MKTVIVIQARLGSTRLPGKVLLPTAGAPMLQRMVERVRLSALADEIVVATTTRPEDDAIRALCRAIDAPCFSGHPTDLLDRHYRAGLEHRADVVLKVPSDCPLVDPLVIDRVIERFLAAPGAYDYMSNLHPETYPDGSDVEVMPMAALETAWREAARDYEREHTTPYLWDHPERFRVGNVAWETGLDLSRSHRLTVDYWEDYALVAAVFDALWSGSRPYFGLLEILHLLDAQPLLRQMNARHLGVSWYRHHLSELRTLSAPASRPWEAA